MLEYPNRAARLRKRRDFLRLRHGHKAVKKGLIIQALKREGASNLDAPIRVGFTATKKIGNAVIRNRAKRRLREIARLLLPTYGSGDTDYVFIARAQTPTRTWSALLADAKSALVSLARSTSGEPRDKSLSHHDDRKKKDTATDGRE